MYVVVISVWFGGLTNLREDMSVKSAALRFDYLKIFSTTCRRRYLPVLDGNGIHVSYVSIARVPFRRMHHSVKLAKQMGWPGKYCL